MGDNAERDVGFDIMMGAYYMWVVTTTTVVISKTKQNRRITFDR